MIEEEFNKIPIPNFDNPGIDYNFLLHNAFTPCRYYELTRLLPGQIFMSRNNERLMNEK